MGVFLCIAGVSHFRSTESFLAQVPLFIPNPVLVIYVSGIVELALGLGLILFAKYKRPIGIATAIFFVIIFPGNISQFLTHTSAFGLDTDVSRGLRLLFQPILVVIALWSTRISKD